MTDREKIIAWLADKELYYRDHGDTHNSLMACYALDLLKEQREEIENLKQTAQSMMEGMCLLKEQEAEWLDVDDKHDAFDCSNCGAMAGRKCLYCPGCGAKMKNGTRAMKGR